MGKGGGGCSMETLILMHFLIFLQFVPDDLNLSRGMIYVTQRWKLRQVCVRTKRGTQVLALLKRSHRGRRMREFALWWWAGHHFDGYTVFLLQQRTVLLQPMDLLTLQWRKIVCLPEQSHWTSFSPKQWFLPQQETISSLTPLWDIIFLNTELYHNKKSLTGYDNTMRCNFSQ